MAAGASGPGATFGRRKVSIWGDETEVSDIELTDLVPNPFNPRKVYKQQELDELTVSIQASGQLQEMSVAPADEFFDFWLTRVKDRPREVAKLTKAIEDAGDLSAKCVILIGHRRARALAQAGETHASCVVKASQIPEARILGLPENTQRVGLNAMEEAEGYQGLLDDGIEGQVEVAKLAGVGQGTVSKRLALLQLPEDLQEAIREGNLSADAATRLLTDLKHEDPEQRAVELTSAWALMRDSKMRAAAAAATVRASGIPSEYPGAGGDVSVLELEGEPEGSPLPGPRQEAIGQGTPPAEEAPAAAAKKPRRVAQTPAAAAPTPASKAAEARDAICQLIVTAGDFDNPRQTVRLLAPVVVAPGNVKATQELAFRWLRAALPAVHSDAKRATAFFDAVAASGDATLTTRAALAVALATAEVRASDLSRTWDARDRAHIAHLRESGYEPTEWDRSRLDS